MQHVVATFLKQRNLKQIQNEKGMTQQISGVNHIDDDRVSPEKSVSVLRRSSTRNIVFSACFIFEKEKLHSKYG